METVTENPYQIFFKGRYSEAQAEFGGSYIYEDINGKEVEVTQVWLLEDEPSPDYFKDSVVIKETLVKFLRPGNSYKKHWDVTKLVREYERLVEENRRLREEINNLLK